MEDENKIDDAILPGFRFHPTDEELVGFYLKKKILDHPLPIELIKQVDIYKYDPWDLPKLGGRGEKEWYFYCPRDRKYRNSTRPNRVTGAGFWKATGTDRPIYSSHSKFIIGLKKSLVFYRGRAAKGIKTDWMMHEFRLPSSSSSSSHHSAIPDSWAICRIFKKTNSMAQRGLSHSWVSPTLPESTSLSDIFNLQVSKSSVTDLSPNLMFPPMSTAQVSSMLMNLSPASGSLSREVAKGTDNMEFGVSQQYMSGFPNSLAQNVQWNSMRSSIGFPFHLPSSSSSTSVSNSATCPSELSTSYSSSKGYR